MMDLYEIDDNQGSRIYSLGSSNNYSPSGIDSKRIEAIEREIEQMHSLLNELCPGSNSKGSLTAAEKFRKLLEEGPGWAVVKENK